MGIPKLLDPEDIYNQTDKLSIITQMSLWKTKLSGGTFGFGKKVAAVPKQKDEKIKPSAHNKSLLSAGSHGKHAASTSDLPSKSESEPTVTLVVPPPLLSASSSPSVLSVETVPSPRKEGKNVPSMTLSAPNSPLNTHAAPEVKSRHTEHKHAAEAKTAAEVKKPSPETKPAESKPAAESAKPAAKPKASTLMVHSPTLSRLSTDSSPSTPGSGGVAAARLRFNQPATSPAADPKQKPAAKPAAGTIRVSTFGNLDSIISPILATNAPKSRLSPLS